jgi:DNA primase
MTPLELLEKNKIYFKVAGNDLLIKCLNPEHDDTNPSMRVDKVSGIFHCFACGYKGNLLQRFNVYRSKTQVVRERLKEKIVTHLAQNNGLQMPESAEPWDMSYRGISKATYAHFKAFTHEDFPDRIVFPITEVTGKIVLFQARSVGGTTPKYLFYPRHVQPPIFPLPVTPIMNSVVLVEGIFDVLNLYDKGIKNVVCCFGTQSVTEDKLQLLHMLGVSTINVFFDGDKAGQVAASKVSAMITSCGFSTNNVYAEGKDPGELTSEEVERLKQNLWPEYYE